MRRGQGRRGGVHRTRREILGEDRRAGAVVLAHVEEPRPRLRAQRVMVNHDLRHAPRRETNCCRSPGCVSSSAIAGHWPQFTREAGSSFSRSSRISAQFSARPAIALAADPGADARLGLDEPLQGAGARERVRVRVVVDHDQQPARAAEDLQQFVPLSAPWPAPAVRHRTRGPGQNSASPQVESYPQSAAPVARTCVSTRIHVKIMKAAGLPSVGNRRTPHRKKEEHGREGSRQSERRRLRRL